MSSKKRSYGTGVSMSAMSTGALMKKARAYEAAKAVRNRAPRVKGAIQLYGGRQELKYSDTVISQEFDGTAGILTPLNLLAIGDDNTSRDGRQVCIKSVQLALGVNRVAGAANESVRVMLVWDNAVNSGAAPAVLGTILDNAVVTEATACFPKVDNAQRFTILYDSKIQLGPLSTTATQAVAAETAHRWDVYKRLNLVTQYSGTTAAIGSIQNGGLYLVTLGFFAAGSTCTGGARIRFTDQ